MQDVGILVQTPLGLRYVYNIRGHNPVKTAKTVNLLSTIFLSRRLIAAKAEYCLQAYNKSVTTKKRSESKYLFHL